MIARHTATLSATLCFIAFITHFAAIAQDIGERNEISREQVDAEFGPAEYETMHAKSSEAAQARNGAVTPSRLSAAAELVILATVREITYTYEHHHPYTNTTFAVDRVIKGEHTGSELTLTQSGGPSLDGRHVTIFSHTEFFHEGERVILFLVEKKSQWHVMARFSIDEGLVFDADGYGITMSQDGAIGLTKARNDDIRFRTIDVGVDVLSKNFSDPEGVSRDSVDGAPDQHHVLAPDAVVGVDEFIAASEPR